MLKTKYIVMRRGFGLLGFTKAFSEAEAFELACKKFSNPESIYVVANKRGKGKTGHKPIRGSRSGLNK